MIVQKKLIKQHPELEGWMQKRIGNRESQHRVTFGDLLTHKQPLTKTFLIESFKEENRRKYHFEEENKNAQCL